MRCESCLVCLVWSETERAKISSSTNLSQKWYLLPVWFEKDRQNSSKSFRESLSYQDCRCTTQRKIVDILIQVLHISSSIFAYSDIFFKIFTVTEKTLNNNKIIWRPMWMAKGVEWVPELTNLYSIKKIYCRKYTNKIRLLTWLVISLPSLQC